jgi:hypothetical protein
MQMDGEVRLSPAWKHALSVLLEGGMEYGRVIHKRELCEMFGLADPVTAADQVRHQMEFTQQFTALRDELLEEHRLRLRTMYGESSYEVVHPGDQTDLSMAEGLRDLRTAARKMARSLAFIRHEELTDEQRRKNTDAQAKAAMLAGMIRNPRLPSPKQ